MKPETKAIHIQTKRSQEREHSSPLFLTSSFTFDDAEQMRATFADELEGNIYSRFTNPNVKELIDKICVLEGADTGVATASGMAAIFSSFMGLLKSGDHILASNAIFGSAYTVISKYLPKWGIEYTFADINKPETWEKLIQKNTKMIFVETPSNPGLNIVDLKWLGNLAKKKNIILNVDNCFASPIIQQPIKFGAHIVTHSATKYIDGQGRVLGGIIVGKKELIKEIQLFCRSTGPSLSPFNAWILSKSIETLHVRMERHCENAFMLATALEKNKNIIKVNYPFLKSHPSYSIAKKQMSMGGGIVTFEIKGGLKAGKKFLNAVKMCSLTANLGDTKTIVSHPASTTHAKLSEKERLESGITPGMVRVSVGLENIEDILHDVEQALNKSY